MPTHCDDAGHGHRRAPLRQAIVDLDDRKVLAVLDTGVVPVSTQTQDFDEATVDARFGLRPALKPIRITQPQGKNFTIDGGFIS